VQAIARIEVTGECNEPQPSKLFALEFLKKTEWTTMEKLDINNLIREARKIAPKCEVDPITGKVIAKVTPSTDADYKKYAHPIFGLDKRGKLIIPECAGEIIARVKTALTDSTLNKRATAVRYIAVNQLGIILDDLDVLATLGRWDMVERSVTHAKFKAIRELATMYPAEYKVNWQAARKKKGKKNSANGLQDEWLEQLIPTFSGQYRIPATVAALTGLRPSELTKGVLLRRNGVQLFADISGAKVTDHAGQETRVLQIHHYLKSILLDYMDLQEDPSQVLVKVIKGNSVTTHIRAKARRLFKEHKQSITSYTLRHNIASAIKRLVADGQADPDSVSMLLGHRVDKTATFYGHHSKSSNGGMAPTVVSATHSIRRKLGPKNDARRSAGKMPSQRRRLRRGSRR
jgi:integrase